MNMADPAVAPQRVSRRSRAMMKHLREKMQAMEAAGIPRIQIASGLGLTPAQVTRCLGAKRCWRDRRL